MTIDKTAIGKTFECFEIMRDLWVPTDNQRCSIAWRRNTEPRRYICMFRGFSQVAAWVSVFGVLSYARMWVYEWARRGGTAGMRACGFVTQLGSALGSLALYFVVNYTDAFVEAPPCAERPL
ncbi:jg7998 [Pararge aegeria aegeria]|uniref:Riboflavin transporter n=1 Tax=Pararge aegeria aegeria TaxID=348720 RepID=A0A8S4RIU8_9NEOP|nr:jg7998 [Pararge aegeria aegeria]